jgi:PAS domain S-box-containing protein
MLFDSFSRTPRKGFSGSTENGRYLLLNPAMARIFGYDSPEEMMRTVQEHGGHHFVDPADGKILRETIKSADCPADREIKVRRKDGQIIRISVNSRCVRDDDGRIRYCEGVVTDITERKKMERALMDSEEEYRLLVENALDAVFVVQDGTMKFANRVAEDVLGYTRQEIAGRPFVEFIHPDDRELVYGRYPRG